MEAAVAVTERWFFMRRLSRFAVGGDDQLRPCRPDCQDLLFATAWEKRGCPISLVRPLFSREAESN